MSNRVFLVTGATSGIGKAIAFGLAKTGETVLLTARDQDKRNAVYDQLMAEAQNPNVEILACDLSSIGSIKNFVSFIKPKYSKIDVLINNAGVLVRERKTSVDGHELMLATNHLGPFLLTHLLREPLKAGGARILNITAPSNTPVNFDDLESKQSFNYLNVFGATKMMNLLYTLELARRAEGSGITVNAIHPGLARSNLMKESPAALQLFLWLVSAPPKRVAADVLRVALLPEFAAVTGKLLHKGKEMKMPSNALDQEAQRKLWDATMDLLNLNEPAADHSSTQNAAQSVSSSPSQATS